MQTINCYNSKMMKFIRIFLLVLIIIGIGLLLTQKTWVPKLVNKIIAHEDSVKIGLLNEVTYKNATADLIAVSSPAIGASVNKKFTIEGKARGPWYFEASFPIEILGRDFKPIAKSTATAVGEWMTNNFVPFKGQIEVPASYSGDAIMVFQRDNPSGDTNKAAYIYFPINIK